jgi:hypothetical protein
MKTITRIKLAMVKRKFRGIYRAYDEYMASHDGGNEIVDIISTRRKDMCAELNGLMEKICTLELQISGTVPFDINKMKFE